MPVLSASDLSGSVLLDGSRMMASSLRPAMTFSQVDYAMGSAAAAAASGVVLACNGMTDDAPPDVPGNENSSSGSSWWCGGCL